MRYTPLAVFVLFLLLIPFAAVQAEDPAAKPEETWMRVHISGAHSGFEHHFTKEVPIAGGTRIETHTRSELKINRLGQILEIKSSSVTWEKPDGTLLRIEADQKMSAMVTKSIFTFDEGKLTVQTTTMGKERTVELEIQKDLVGPAAIDRQTRTLAGTTGQKVSATTFVADFQRAVKTTLTSKGPETVKLHDGSSVELTRVEASLEGIPGMTPISWLDASGETLATKLEITGMTIESFRVKSEAEAKGQGEAKTKAPDVFTQSLIQETDPIPVPRQLERAWYTIKRRTENAVMPTVTAVGYGLTTSSADVLEVQADRMVPPSGREGVRPLARVPEELKDALAASSMIQSDAEEIIKVATDVVGDETNAWRAAQKLERWVFEHMTEKNFSTAFGSALEACRSGEGDCTEHAVLLAAVCRAAGIPARVVMGVEYLYGIWGGHAWNDVWIDGTWYQLDATNGHGFVDPLHLPMAHMTMKEGGASEFIQMIGSIGSLDIDITKVVRDARTIVVNDSAKLVTTKDGQYRNAIWGIGFQAPDGYSIRPVSGRAGMSARISELTGKTPDGKPMRIRVDAMDAGPASTIETGLRTLKWETAQAGTIDGRPSRTKTSSRGDQTLLQSIVVDDGALYVFTFVGAAGDEESQAFQALLDSVDLDVR